MEQVFEKDLATPISEVYDFDGYTIFLSKDNIMQLKFKPKFHGEEKDARNMIDVFRKIMKGEKCLALVIYQEDNMFTKEAREYIATDEVGEVVKADALIITGLPMKLIGNFYLQINKPKRPTRMFTKPEDGLKWLQQFK